MASSKDDWKKRFDEPSPAALALTEAQEKARLAITEEMANLVGHPGWQRILSHAETHREGFVKELELLRQSIMQTMTEVDIRTLQLRHAYRQGYLDGMHVMLTAPGDLANPQVKV